MSAIAPDLAERVAQLERRLTQPSVPVLDTLVPARVLAERLDHRDRKGQVTTRVLEEWRANGTGPAFVRVGRIPFYRPEAIAEWLLSNEHRSTAEEL